MADQIAGKYADRLGYKRQSRAFNILLYLRSRPMVAYNYFLLTLMITGTYFPFKISQWWFQKSLILLKTYLRFFGKKSVYK